MGKIGRNDPCPCGSGKKYKKCCLGKIDVSPPSATPVFADQTRTSTRWNMDQVENLSTWKIVQMLIAFGVDYDPDRFVAELNQFGSTSAVAAHWEKIYPVTAEGFDVDFIRLAARVLRNRLEPGLIVTDALDEQMQEGYKLMEARKYAEGCRLWLDIWEHLKKRFTPDMKSIADAEVVFEGTQSLQNWCQDMEMELGNAGRKDNAFTRKRIAYCRAFYQLFPDSLVLIIQNMRRAEAESHFDLGECEQGEALFKAFIQDYPNSAWGYIGWGDMYWLFRTNEQVPLDYEKAERIYQMALDEGVTEDRDEVLERLEDLRTTRNEQSKENEIEHEDSELMTLYNPLETPVPETWLTLDEGERILMVEDYHKREEIDLPSLKLHASFHVIIENQLADGNPPEATQTFTRMLEEGLDRHDAIHALSSALSKPMFETLKNSSGQQNPTEQYVSNLKNLTAQKWLDASDEG